MPPSPTTDAGAGERRLADLVAEIQPFGHAHLVGSIRIDMDDVRTIGAAADQIKAQREEIAGLRFERNEAREAYRQSSIALGIITGRTMSAESQLAALRAPAGSITREEVAEAVETFVHAYRQRYTAGHGRIRSGAPMRAEVAALNEALLSRITGAAHHG